MYVQAAPTALASIGWKYYLIFIIITFLSTFLFAFVFPETKGRSLEELNAEFGDEVAVDYSESSKVDFTQLRETMLHNFSANLTSDNAVPQEQLLRKQPLRLTVSKLWHNCLKISSRSMLYT